MVLGQYWSWWCAAANFMFSECPVAKFPKKNTLATLDFVFLFGIGNAGGENENSYVEKSEMEHHHNGRNR